MSLVRSADSSSTSFGDSDTSSSAHIYASDKRKFGFGPQSYYSPQCSSTSSDEQVSFLHASSKAPISVPIFRPQVSTSYQFVTTSGSTITVQDPYTSFSGISRSPQFDPSCSVSEFLDTGSAGNGINYDEEDIRLKLQELERALLDDTIDEVFDPDQGMLIDGEWEDPIKDLLLPNSPKESSSDSNLSTISSDNKETAQVLHQTPKKLLFACAAAIAEDNMNDASTLISQLRQMVSIQGDPPQRIAAYMVEGLAARMAASGQGLYKALKCKEPPTSDRLSAMQILFEVCPCFKFGFMAANGAIAEAVKDAEHVHIIDFDINQGSQYFTLIQALASRPGKPPHLRITGVDDIESVQRSVGGLKIIGQRLEQLAEAVGVPFEFRALSAKAADVTPSLLDSKPHEALIVNFAFQLHHMPDESVSTVNQRDQLLRMVKSLEPKLVTIVEQEVNTNTAPFFPRFVEAYNYYSAVFESLDATLPRESPDRMNVERQCLARDIVNIVACEGEDRIERYEVAGKWRARMTMAGFVSCPLSSYVNSAIRSLLKSYCNRYKVKEEGGALYFGWEDKILIVASAWK
ncbi:scarecrow-like protein 1 [Aristolochia californica]|uniref:scarecrow-like protein 1 n=1 Tax=Aristolochia californica TaxID=171875 RepID=UPI0035D6CEFD